MCRSLTSLPPPHLQEQRGKKTPQTPLCRSAQGKSTTPLGKKTRKRSAQHQLATHTRTHTCVALHRAHAGSLPSHGAGLCRVWFISPTNSQHPGFQQMGRPQPSLNSSQATPGVSRTISSMSLLRASSGCSRKAWMTRSRRPRSVSTVLS